MIEKIIVERKELKKCYTECQAPLLQSTEWTEQEPDDVDLNRVMLEILVSIHQEHIHNKGDSAA